MRRASKESRHDKTTRRGRRLHGFRPWRWIVPLVLLLCLATYLALTHPFFRIKYVQVEGNVLLTPAEVVAQMKNVNRNIFLYGVGEGRKEVQSIPGVDAVSIARVLPNRIRVKIHEIFLLGEIHEGDRVFYVDQDGRVLDALPKEITNKKRQPFLENLRRDLKAGDRMSEDHRLIELLQYLAQTAIVGDVGKVNFENVDNIVIIYKNIVISFGPPNDIVSKMGKMEAVVADIESKRTPAVEIYLNQGDDPIVVTQQ